MAQDATIYAVAWAQAEPVTMLSGEDAANDMTLTADKRDNELGQDTVAQRHAAKNAFDVTVKLLMVVLENTTLIAEKSSAVRCSCGRRGHLHEQCTFKSPLAPRKKAHYSS